MRACLSTRQKLGALFLVYFIACNIIEGQTSQTVFWTTANFSILTPVVCEVENDLPTLFKANCEDLTISISKILAKIDENSPLEGIIELANLKMKCDYSEPQSIENRNLHIYFTSCKSSSMKLVWSILSDTKSPVLYQIELQTKSRPLQELLTILEGIQKY